MLKLQQFELFHMEGAEFKFFSVLFSLSWKKSAVKFLQPPIGICQYFNKHLVSLSFVNLTP